MPDKSPEFSKDGLEWTQNLDKCIKSTTTTVLTAIFERVDPPESSTADMASARAIMEGALFK